MVNTCRQLILALVMFAPACVGQTATPTPASSPSPSVPTTKILAVGRMLTAMTDEQRRAIMPREVPATVRLYLDGKIDQWWVREDGQGVVFLMNVGSVEEARTLLEKLPLGQAKLMTFDLIPLGPLSPLRLLLRDSASASQQ